MHGHPSAQHGYHRLFRHDSVEASQKVFTDEGAPSLAMSLGASELDADDDGAASSCCAAAFVGSGGSKTNLARALPTKADVQA